MSCYSTHRDQNDCLDTDEDQKSHLGPVQVHNSMSNAPVFKQKI